MVCKVLPMEQHAVPQDITGFKFKLVGDMTLKQFGELAAGAILAYLFYASSWSPLLKWPLVITFSLSGIALAFLPIEERPLDLWIINFLRAIYRPTLYVWKRDNSGAAILENGNITTKPPMKPQAFVEPEEELGLAPWPYPKEEPEKPAETKIALVEPEVTPAPVPPPLSVTKLQELREEKLTELERARQQLQEATKRAKEETFKTQIGPSVVTVDQLAKMREEKVAQSDADLKSQVAVGETELNQLISQNKALIDQSEDIKNQIWKLSGADTTQLQQKLDVLSGQKTSLSAKIAALSDKLAAQRAAPLTQPAYEPRAVAAPTPGVRVVEKPKEQPVTISLSNQPNIISGMVVSNKGAPMEGVIILIKDTAGNSIRALKTNKLGQFVVATPMENGTYYVEMEKVGYQFNVLEVTLTGQVLAPLEIPAQAVSSQPLQGKQ